MQVNNNNDVNNNNVCRSKACQFVNKMNQYHQKVWNK